MNARYLYFFIGITDEIQRLRYFTSYDDVVDYNRLRKCILDLDHSGLVVIDKRQINCFG